MPQDREFPMLFGHKLLMSRFLSVLRQHRLQYEFTPPRLPGGKPGIVVQGTLELYGMPLAQLPDDLTITGSLSITGNGLARLPRRLVVHDSLSILRSNISSLPEDISVGHHIGLSDSKVTALPKGLHVKGTLDLNGSQVRSLPDHLRVDHHLALHGTPVQELPPGLCVGCTLDVSDTRITRFPLDMQVDGTIVPPNGLADIQAFMAVQDNPLVFLDMAPSYHGRMAQQASLLPFPDLLRVVDALHRHGRFLVLNTTEGGITAKVEHAAP